MMLVATMALAAAAACGPAAPQPALPGNAVDPSQAPVPPGGVVAPGTPATPVASASPAAGAPAAPPGVMKPPIATAFAGELTAIGLDPSKLPPLSKLEGDKLRKVMKLFTRSLGVRCGDCHTDDFAAPTPRKNVASRMWDEFSRGLTRLDGGPVFCDSCHQGKLSFLDRRDMKALSKWMDEHYVDELKRVAAGAGPSAPLEHGCATCHGDPFEGDILELWRKPVEKKGVTKRPTQR